jgi:hypothetical protein
VCRYGTLIRRPSDQSEAQTSHPALLGKSLHILLISFGPQQSDYLHAQTRSAASLPIALGIIAIRSLAHGGFTRCGQSCFPSAPADCLQPEQADNITRANNTAFHRRCKAFPRVGLTSTFHERHFISLTYPAHDLECITSGASADLVDHATFNTTRAAVLVVSHAVEHS